MLDYSSDGDILVAFKIYGQPLHPKTALKLPGDTLLVDGPYGSFLQEPSVPPESVFIAGGIGVTPFLSVPWSSQATTCCTLIVLASQRYCELF